MLVVSQKHNVIYSTYNYSSSLESAKTYTESRIISAANPSQTMATAATWGLCRFERGVDYGRGSRENKAGVKSEQECCAFCANEPSCVVATYIVVQEQCWFKGQDALSRPPSDGGWR